MKRIERIKSTLRACAEKPTTFNDLPLGAQVKVVYSVLYRVISGRNWWQRIMEDDEQSPELRQRAAEEVAARNKVIPSCQDFLARAANYSSGADEEVLFDSTYAGDEGTTGGYEYVVATVNGHPFAWARNNLMENGVWDDSVPHSKEPLAPQLFDADKVYNKYAARYAATLLLMEFGLITPREDDTQSDIVLISALSPRLKKVLASDTVHQLFDSFAHTPFTAVHYDSSGCAVKTSYNQVDLVNLWRKAVELDKEDAEREAVIAEREARVKALRQQAEQAITTAVILKEIAALTKEMKAAGLSDETIAAVTQAALS